MERTTRFELATLTLASEAIKDLGTPPLGVLAIEDGVADTPIQRQQLGVHLAVGADLSGADRELHVPCLLDSYDHEACAGGRSLANGGTLNGDASHGSNSGTFRTMMTSGELLRRWRRGAGIRQADLADRLGIAKSTVSQWESDRRSISAPIDDVDAALGAAGSFAALRWALTTETALGPSCSWIHNFTEEETGPVWAWIRHRQSGRVPLRFSWGDWAGAAEVPPGGLVLTSPVSLSGPPVVVRLTAPGWVDVGRGVLPGWFGVERLDAMEFLSSPPVESSYFFRLLGSRLRDDLTRSGRTAVELAGFLDLSVVPVVLEDTARPAPLAERVPATTSATRTRSTIDGAAVTRIRQARGLSRRQVVRAANALNAIPPEELVSPHWLRAIESGREPEHPPNAIGRLDLVLGGHGQLVCLETSPAQTALGLKATVPSWWVGPVWFEIESSVEEVPTTVMIRWRGYIRGLVLCEGTTVVACTKVAPTDELPVITSEMPVTVTAGIGARNDAVDINRYWFPESGTTSEGLFDQAMEMILSHHGRTVDDYQQFLTGSA